MKLTLIKRDGQRNNEVLSTLTYESFVEKLKKETRDHNISLYRLWRTQMNETDDSLLTRCKIHQVYPAVEYHRRRDGSRFLALYNGVVQLEVNQLADLIEVREVKRQAALLPQTLAAFCGCDGHSVVVWVRFSRPDGTLPRDARQAAFFHAHAYRMAVACYQPLFSFPITLSEPVIDQHCAMSLDEAPYWHPDAVPFVLEQPLALPGEQTLRAQNTRTLSPVERMTPGADQITLCARLYQQAMAQALEQVSDWRRDDGPEKLLPRLIEACYNVGLPEEEAVCRTMMDFYDRVEEGWLRLSFRNGYKMSKGLGQKSVINKEREATEKLEEFLHRRYEFRFNTLRDEVEYRERNSLSFRFEPLDKRVRNTIAIQALKEGLQVWDRDVDRFLGSRFVPMYNPIEEYLYDVGQWDGVDRIRSLAQHVPCNNPHWENLFCRWFLGMVAHWRGMDTEHGNSISPLLVGAQGYRKSTFCRILLPPELRFGYTDSIDFSSKLEAERALSRFFLINLDEFDQITLSQQGFLKHLLQKPVSHLRKPYGTAVREVRRYASFIGTSNQKDLLSDPTGSRRFICVEVTAPIDTNVTIDYRQLYAQAIHQLCKGERYWLDATDEAILKRTNAEFQQVTPLEHLFLAHFESIPADSPDGEWLTAMQIFEQLQSHTREVLPVKQLSVFGRILRKLEVPWRTSKRGTEYHVRLMNVRRPCKP